MDSYFWFLLSDEVPSLLKVLDIMLCWFDHDFGSGMSFSSVFEKFAIQTMYHQLKQLESLLTYYSTDGCSHLSFHGRSSEIVQIVLQARDYIFDKVKEFSRLKKGEQAESSSAQSTSIHVLETMLTISNKEEHLLLYDAVVSLLHDLRLILSSHGHTCDSEQRFRKGDIQIMYDNLSMTESLLVDSSGQGYDKNLMNSLEQWVYLVTYVGQHYIDLWPQSLIEKQSTGSFPPPSKYIIDHQLHELTQRMENINQELIGLTEKQPTGSFPPPSEDIFEPHGTTSTDGAAQVSCQNLRQITKCIEFLKNRLKRIRGGRDITSTQSLQGTTSTGQVFIKLNKLSKMPNEGGKLVGFQHDFSKMLDRLTGYPPKLQVLTVVGIGGIGKTTFTESLYDDPLVRYQFHIRSWFTISRQYQVKEVLVGLLRCLTNPKTELYGKSIEDLKQALYQCLKGKKYLIVLDDMWDKQAWNDLKRLFPNDENGSRIMLTTRLIDVAKFASPDIQPHRLPRLSPDESWELLRSKIPKLCPPELEPIGKQIACKCQGLPLAIVVVAGLLSKMNMTLEEWKDAAKSTQSLIEKQSTGSFPPPSSKHIFDDHMHKLTEMMENVNQELIRLTGKQPTGSFPPSSEHIFELQGTTSADGAAQVSCQNLHRITKRIEFVNNRLKRICDGRDIIQTSTQSLQGTTSTCKFDYDNISGQVSIKLNKLPRLPNKGGKLVGFQHDLLVMLDRLIGYPPKLQVFTVVGMGGIGKTTFTESLYDDPLVRYHFDIRAWFTISQQYQVTEVLIGLLRCLTDPTTEIYGKSNDELELALYQSLKGKTYLIVLDDMWDKQAWNDLKRIFPNDENGSRIILTTRLIDVAEFASPDTQPHCLPRLSPGESWELLCSKIQIKELCPPELEPIGKQIACKCQGLPLAIVVVAGLLSKMNMTLEVWEEIAKSVCSQEQCQNILALSYNHLPDHLKLCFLYMGIFPEDSKIPAKKLIWLWIGEGFIQPRKLKSLEEVAENYLEDLIGRSLVQVNRRRYDGRFKTCFLHDMLRDLCLRESHKQHFFLVFHENLKSMINEEIEKFSRKCRRVCFHSRNTLDTTTISWLSNTRSFLWFKTITSIDLKSYSIMNLKRLKVLDIIDGHLEELPRDIVPILANFRYLAVSFQNSIDRSIFSSTFHNIQILIVEGEWNGQLPKEFWTMSELRHFYLKRSFLSYWPEQSRPNIMQLALASESPQTLIYPVQYEEHSIKVLQNLRSLTTIRPISCTEAVFLSMPNLKKLGVFEDEEDCGFRGWFKNLVHLKELQTLKYVFRDPFTWQKPDRLPSQNFILAELINLTINGTAFPWEDMLKLCALPKLEVLKLKNRAFIGPTWTLEPETGGFPCLKYLLIRTTNLQSWEADATHFPKLQHLVMMNCRLLKEIPCGIFEAPLLERIELHNCSETTVDSAEQLQQEQLDNGNDSLVLHITPDCRQR